MSRDIALEGAALGSAALWTAERYRAATVGGRIEVDRD